MNTIAMNINSITNKIWGFMEIIMPTITTITINNSIKTHIYSEITLQNKHMEICIINRHPRCRTQGVKIV